jgi:hypothetical protein
VRTLKELWTDSAAVVREDLTEPDEIQEDLGVPDAPLTFRSASEIASWIRAAPLCSQVVVDHLDTGRGVSMFDFTVAQPAQVDSDDDALTEVAVVVELKCLRPRSSRPALNEESA